MLIRWCLLGSVILLAFASSSCVRSKKKKAADQTLNQGFQENFVIPAPKAKILGERELQALVSLSPAGELVFAEGGTSGQQNLVEPNAFNVGDILVIGTHPAAPEGALRRVTAVNNSGQMLVIQTEQAALTDAIKDAYVKVSIPMDPTQAKETLPPQEGIVQQNPALLKLTDTKQGLYFGINDYVLFDVDGNKSTKNDQVVLNGNLGVDAGADIVFRIESFSIKEVSISVHGDQSASLSLVGTGSASFKEKIDISLLYFTPIVITIGSFPIVITPSLGIALGAEGEVNSKFRTSANEEAHVKIGVGYLDGEFKPITEGTVEGKAEPPAISAANLSSRAYATIKGNLSLYGSSGGYAGMEAFARFNANLIDESCFKAHAGLGAQVGLFAGLFGLKIADYAKSWDIISKEIGVGSCNVKGATGSDPQAYSWLYTEPTTDDDVDFPFYDASSDGGLVSTRGRNRNGYALKLAANGASVFYRDSQATHAESFRNIKTLKDGGSLIAGSSVGAVLLRLNPQGAVQWASLYKNSGTYRIYAAAESPGDGSLLVGGMVYTSDDVNDDMFLLKVSATGEVLWSKRFKGPNNSDAIRSIAVLTDGKIVLGGSYGITSGMAGIDPIDQTKASMGWLAILDSAGTVQKSKLYSSKSIVDVLAIKDGAEGFTVLGETERTVGSTSVPVPWVMRLDASGTLVWRQGFLDYVLPRSLAASSEGFLISGIRNYATGGDARKNHDGWLAHLSSSGTILWAKTYGSTLEDGLLYVHQNSDGRILAGGYQVPAAMTLKPWFLSLASSGDASFTPGTDFSMSNTSAALFTPPLSYVDAPLTVSDLAVTRENWDRTLTLGSIKSEPIAAP